VTTILDALYLSQTLLHAFNRSVVEWKQILPLYLVSMLKSHRLFSIHSVFHRTQDIHGRQVWWSCRSIGLQQPFLASQCVWKIIIHTVRHMPVFPMILNNCLSHSTIVMRAWEMSSQTQMLGTFNFVYVITCIFQLLQ
jgi:hypothetical protein